MHQTIIPDGTNPFMKVHHPSLDVFSPAIKDESIINYEMVELSPSGTPQGKNIIEYQTPSYEFKLDNLNDWFNLSEGYIQCQVEIIDPTTNQLFANGSQITLVNNCLNLFKRVQYQQNNITVEETEQPGIIEQIKGLMNYSKDQEQYLTQELWSPDRGNGYWNFNQSNTSIGNHLLQFSADGGGTWTDITDAQLQYVAANNSIAPVGTTIADTNIIRVNPHVVSSVLNNTAYNSGGEKRMMMQKTSPTSGFVKQYSFRIPLRKLFSYFDYNRIIHKGVEHKFKLYVNEQNRMLFRSNQGVDRDGRLLFTYMALWVPLVEPSKMYKELLSKQMSQGTHTTLGWNKFTYHVYDNALPIGSSSPLRWTVPVSEARPKKVYLFLQRADALTSQLVNSMIFPMQSISKAWIKYNGKIFPEYTFDFNDISVINRDAVGVPPAPTPNVVGFPDNKSFLRVYEEFLRLSNKQFGTIPPSITYDEFVNLYAIICFDLSRVDEDKVFNSMSKAQLDIEVQFDANRTGVLPLLNGAVVGYPNVPANNVTGADTSILAHCVIESESFIKLGSKADRLVPIA